MRICGFSSAFCSVFPSWPRHGPLTRPWRTPRGPPRERAGRSLPGYVRPCGAACKSPHDEAERPTTWKGAERSGGMNVLEECGEVSQRVDNQIYVIPIPENRVVPHFFGGSEIPC